MLKDCSIQQYTELLADKAPTPGGGSSLAVVVLNALALCEMALNVTSGKLQKQNKDTTAIDAVAKEYKILRQLALSVVDKDTIAFDNILQSMRLPKDTEQQKQERTVALQNSYVQSAQLCLQLMRTASKGYVLADKAIQLSDKFVVSDAKIGKTLLATSTICCQYNVDINVDYIADKTVQQQLRDERDSYLAIVQAK